MTHILNGESLINDASGLVAFKFAVAAVATGAFSFVEAAEQFVVLAAGGSLVGLAAAALMDRVGKRVRRVVSEEPTVHAILSLLMPYAAYLLAEALHVSGILAVVAAGLYMGSQDTRDTSVAHAKARRRGVDDGALSPSTASCSCCSASRFRT